MSILRFVSRTTILLSGLVALYVSASQANAQMMTLTSGAVSAGYKLTTFATGFPNQSNIGPLGVTFPSTGGVLVSEFSGNVRRFAFDVDGQTASSAINVTNYGSGNAPRGFVSVGGKNYLAMQGGGTILQINDDTSLNHVVASGLNGPLGLVTNPLTGHLFASLNGSGKIVDVNPLTGATTDVITGLSDVDGISLSSDGTVVYAAVRGNGRLQGYNVASHSLVFDTSVPFLDGTAVGTGSLAGTIFANTTNGFLVQVDLTTGVKTTIGQNGYRGDFVSVDPNGTLLLTQTDRILRLTAPPGGGFGVPEPGSIALLTGMAVFGAKLLLRRRRK